MISKLSLYDFFAMIIPGGIIMAAICPLLRFEIPYHLEVVCNVGYVTVENELPAWSWPFMIVIAYFVGLINNWISDGVFRSIRNDKRMIDNQLLRVVELNGIIHLARFGGNKYVKSKEDEVRLIFVVLYLLKKVFLSLSGFKHQIKNHIDYYMVYYILAQHKLLGSIPTLEAQVVLIRNCLIPLFVFALICVYLQSWSLSIILIIISIVLFTIMVQRQNKIYQMVWEAANYYKL